MRAAKALHSSSSTSSATSPIPPTSHATTAATSQHTRRTLHGLASPVWKLSNMLNVDVVLSLAIALDHAAPRHRQPTTTDDTPGNHGGDTRHSRAQESRASMVCAFPAAISGQHPATHHTTCYSHAMVPHIPVVEARGAAREPWRERRRRGSAVRLTVAPAASTVHGATSRAPHSSAPREYGMACAWRGG